MIVTTKKGMYQTPYGVIQTGTPTQAGVIEAEIQEPKNVYPDIEARLSVQLTDGMKAKAVLWTGHHYATTAWHQIQPMEEQRTGTATYNVLEQGQYEIEEQGVIYWVGRSELEITEEIKRKYVTGTELLMKRTDGLQAKVILTKKYDGYQEYVDETAFHEIKPLTWKIPHAVLEMI
jgi:hypothetical protein